MTIGQGIAICGIWGSIAAIAFALSNTPAVASLLIIVFFAYFATIAII